MNKALPRQDVPVAAKVDFLACPDVYPERPTMVEVKETHMSWVFLTDCFVYKMKKPVRNPILDFSTIEARRLNCEREVCLNRRLAPDIYLDIVPLRSDAMGHLNLDGSGQAIDWLVKTRRLPADTTLEHAILSHDVKGRRIQELAETLSEFYRRAPAEAMTPASYCHRYARGIEACRSELSRHKFGLRSATIEQAAKALTWFLDRQRMTLVDRAASRKIVEAHGDLRPEHIYLLDTPVIIDCLEFNRDLRLLDPVEELSYLAMECDRLGDRSIGPRLLQTYSAVTADRPPAPLISFYKCFNAYLRAKIAIWHLDEPDVRNPTKWKDRTNQYLSLAADYIRGLGEAAPHPSAPSRSVNDPP